jgi:squalene-hopene/tetraprenyl-beta-curcumene cyclase
LRFAGVLVLLVASIVNAQNSPDQRAQALVDKGLDFLKTQQKPDGGWANPHEPPGITALVLRAFVLDPKYSSSTDFIKRGYDKLLSYQQPDGGIYDSGLANYNTAIAISSLSAANDPQFKPVVEKAVAYLKSLQWMDMAGVDPSFKYQGEKDAWYGGWGYSNKTHTRGRPDLSNTQMALDALHDAGVSSDDPAYKAAIKFVARMQNSSETNDQAWAGNDGGFVYTPGEDRKGNSAAGDFTSPEGDRRLRSYGSMTYAGLKSFIYAGLSKSDPRVKAAWDWITKNWTLSENPGMRLGNPDNAQQGMYYYYHTLSRALTAFDQPTIDDSQGNSHDWRLELIDKLASLQKPDGSWAGDKRWMEDNPVLVTSYCVLALEEAQKDLKEHPAK